MYFFHYYLRNMETKALESFVTHEFLGGIGDLLTAADGNFYFIEDFVEEYEYADEPEDF